MARSKGSPTNVACTEQDRDDAGQRRVMGRRREQLGHEDGCRIYLLKVCVAHQIHLTFLCSSRNSSPLYRFPGASPYVITPLLYGKHLRPFPSSLAVRSSQSQPDTQSPASLAAPWPVSCDTPPPSLATPEQSGSGVAS